MNSVQICPITHEKLLLSTDGSEFSEGAIREAINFAKRCSSKLYAVTVVQTNPEYETIATNLFEKEELRAKEHLSSIKERALSEGLECETIVCHGDEPYKCIAGEAAQKQVDMIVIGRRGAKGLKKLLIGEVAAKVIGETPCNVLVIPRAAHITYRNILVATDGSEQSNAAVSDAIGIAKRCGSSIIALSSIHSESEREKSQANVNKVVELAQKESIPVEALTPMGRSYNAIVETAGGRGVDLIIVGTPGKTGLKRVLTGSVTEKVIGHADCAVLVVKEK